MVKRRRNNDQEIATLSDPISNLPEDVIKIIFSCLAVRDAVRSSILSKIWRYRWAKLVPQVILNGALRPYNKSYLISNQSMVNLILCQLLLHHEGPIKKLTLDIPKITPSQIDSFIIFHSRNGIEDLTLNNMYYKLYYKLPLSLFKCQQLTHLSLRNCVLEPAPTFKGFSRLSTLRLYNVTISNQDLNGLISGSPFLKLLDLNFFKPCQDVEIEIDAPNLKSFSFGGFAYSLIFKNVPLLAQVSIVGRKHYKSQKRKHNLAEFFHVLPALQDLHIKSLFLTFLAAGEVPTRLPNASLQLKDLTLESVVLDNLHYLSFIFCLIRSSPNLNYINIKFLNINNPVTSYKVIEVLEEQENTGFFLNQLEQVTLNDVTGESSQVEFIQLLLSNSPNLKCMMIYNYWDQTSAQALNIMKQVTKFQRATNKGRVLFGFMNNKQVLTIGGFRGLARTKNGHPYIEFEI